MSKLVQSKLIRIYSDTVFINLFPVKRSAYSRGLPGGKVHKQIITDHNKALDTESVSSHLQSAVTYKNQLLTG